ncbi:STAS domain-containing protein [Nocardioides sediminis]|uniref:STAS domain-containing protein n=1 Tax=Nocardioides sediminis TaxID=433648 RepID=UPI000D3102B4|nr:STAS domain-containing protein [Nocardioides sediminis]
MSSTTVLQHRAAVSGRQYRLHLEGEADLAVLENLETALEAIDLHVVTDVRIDASGLTFIDLGCVRALVDFAVRADREGVAVSVEHAPHALTLVLRYLRPGHLRLV